MIPRWAALGTLCGPMRQNHWKQESTWNLLGNKSKWLETDLCTEFTVHPLGQSLSPRKQNRYGQIGQSSEVAVQIHEHILGWREHCNSQYIQHRRPSWRNAKRTWKQKQVIEHRFVHRIHCASSWSESESKKAESIWAHRTVLRSRGTDPWTYLGVKETLWFPPYSAQATLLKACGKNLETEIGDWRQICAQNSLWILLVRVWVQESRNDLGRQNRPQTSWYRSMNISWGEGDTVFPTIYSTGDPAEGMRKEPGNKSRWLDTDFCTQFTVHPLGQSLSPRKQNRYGHIGQSSEVAVQIHEHILGWRKHCDSHHIQHRRPC